MAANWLQNILTIQKTDTYQARPFNAMTIKGGNKTGKKYERNIKPTTKCSKYIITQPSTPSASARYNYKTRKQNKN